MQEIMKTMITVIIVAAITCLFYPVDVHAEYIAVRTGRANFDICGRNGVVASVKIVNFRPNWAWFGLPKPIIEKGLTTYFHYLGKGLSWDLGIRSEDKQLMLEAEVSSKKDFPLTYASIAVFPGKELAGGKVIYRFTDGSTRSVPIPITPDGPSNVKGFLIQNPKGEKVVDVKIETPASLHSHGNLRVKIADKILKANQPMKNSFILSFDENVKFYASSAEVPNQSSHEGWFAFKPKHKHVNSVIGMEDWLSIPKKQAILIGDKLMVDGKPMKIWGTNVEYSAVAPKKRQNADDRADFFAQNGVNGVRLHKLTNPGWEGLGSKTSASGYDPKKMDRFDYFVNALRKRGITYSFSPIWDLKVFEGDRKKLIAYDEIKKKGDTKGLVWFAKDVQDLHIETLINLIDHKNKYSGIRYAEDHALINVEIQNEENVFFFTTVPSIKRCPTYHRLVAMQFSKWLKKKYGSHKSLVSAWGFKAINTFSSREGAFPKEHLNKENIFPAGNPWMWDNMGKKGWRAKRLQDTAVFFFESQQNYYLRVKNALAKIGYKGPLVASNWQAGSTSAHFLNLMSDAEIGFVDRHNYMGGANGHPAWTMGNGHQLANLTMLNDPCSSLLSVGMQQVKDAPFMFSEWEAVLPVEWAAADTTLVAAYGLGLQDWDASFHMASNQTGYVEEFGPKKFNNMIPVGFGLYPALSRMVLRGDVKPGKVIATRRITFDQAVTQEYDFENEVVQHHDFKSFSGTPHYNALAAGRILIEFVKEATTSTVEDWKTKYKQDDTIVSSTGQLKWTTRGDRKSSYVTINTEGTQGVVGFSPNRRFKLDDVTILTESPYSVVLITAMGKKETIRTDKKVLITAIARCHNTDMNMSETMIYNVGHAPMILEPIKAGLKFKRTAGKITVLDHDGRRTRRTYQMQDGEFKLDTGRDKALYYLVEFK